MSRPEPTLKDVLNTLLLERHQTGQDVIEYPVSLVQRRLRLGYEKTLAFMTTLMDMGLMVRKSRSSIELSVDSLCNEKSRKPT